MAKTYDLAFNQLGITLRNPTTNDLEHYLLREFDGTTRDTYLNGISKIAKTNAKGGTTGVKKFDGLQASLIALCMFHATREEVGNAPPGEEEWVYTLDEAKGRVKEAWVQQLPSHIGNDLFAECQVLCGLGKKANADAKEG